MVPQAYKSVNRGPGTCIFGAFSMLILFAVTGSFSKSVKELPKGFSSGRYYSVIPEYRLSLLLKGSIKQTPPILLERC